MTGVKEYELKGVKTYDIKLLHDERGYFSEAFRGDWSELVGDGGIRQANVSFSYPGIIRAWHRHRRGQVDAFLVLKGAMKIAAFDDEEGSPTRGKVVEIVGSGQRPQIIRIPGHYWHGTKTVSSEPSLTIYFVNRLYDYDDPDEDRRPWDDPKIIDHRTGKAFNW